MQHLGSSQESRFCARGREKGQGICRLSGEDLCSGPGAENHCQRVLEAPIPSVKSEEETVGLPADVHDGDLCVPAQSPGGRGPDCQAQGPVSFRLLDEADDRSRLLAYAFD